MALRPLTVDFETHYTDKANGEYSLTWMTAEQYIRDPRFEIIGVGLQWGDSPGTWITGDLDYIRAELRKIDWSTVVLIGQNSAEFDNLITTEVIGVKPAFYVDTLQIARSIYGGKGADGKAFSASLEKMAEFFGLPAKGQQVKYAINKRRADFTDWQLADYGEYCKHDCWLTWQIYLRMVAKMPGNSLLMASLCAKMWAEPKLMLDGQLLKDLSGDLAARKQASMERVANILNVDPNMDPQARMAATQSLLRKDAVLANVLKNQYDIDPPTKLSPKKKNPDGSPMRVFAFAKTDEGMEELLDFEDPLDPEGADDIQALAAARLAVKSTLAESRVGRLHGISMRGMLPVPLAYGKTHTDRLAGSQKINMQNMGGTKYVTKRTLVGSLVRTPRGIERLRAYNEPTNQIMVTDGTIIDIQDHMGEMQVWLVGLRDTIVAPPGKKIVVVDSSQIELRFCHYIAGQMDTVDELRRGVDVYSSFASTIYARQITKKDKKERQHGKVGMLQLQYQSGGASFRRAARIMGGVRLSQDEADGTVHTYRNRFTQVKGFWWKCQKAIATMAKGGGGYLDDHGIIRIGNRTLEMDDRQPLNYINLRQEMMAGFNGGPDEMQWVYDDKEKRHIKKLYGGATTENICQWGAGYVVKDQTLEIERKYGNYHRTGEGVALMVHDEAVMVVNEDRAEECLDFSLAAFSESPKWMPGLPVAAEGGIGQRYSECK